MTRPDDQVRNMPSVMIVSGCPGSGKTAVAAGLAGRHSRGVHIVSDVFYRFIRDGISPILPESREQNTTVITAAARAAGAFALGGYEVFLDGVFGPWFVPLLAKELLPTGVAVDYVVLRASLERTLDRSADREKPGEEEIVRHMHRQFADLKEFEHHAVDTEMQSLEETVGEIVSRRASGKFRIDGNRAG